MAFSMNMFGVIPPALNQNYFWSQSIKGRISVNVPVVSDSVKRQKHTIVSGLNHLPGIFQVSIWRDFFVEWVKDQQVAFSLCKLITRTGQISLLSPCPYFAPGACHKEIL